MICCAGLITCKWLADWGREREKERDRGERETEGERD